MIVQQTISTRETSGRNKGAQDQVSVTGDMVEATLLKAAEVIARGRGHAVNAAARDHDGNVVDPLSKDAFCFDVTGAIIRAYGELTGNLETPQFDGVPEEVHVFLCDFLKTDNLGRWSDIAVSPTSAFVDAAKRRRELKRLN